MSTEIIVPSLGESITEATIAKWHKKAGEQVKVDELILELETEKVTLEVNSPVSGTISEIIKIDGDTVEVGQVVGKINEGAVTNNTTMIKAQEASKEVNLQNISNSSKANNEILSPAVHRLTKEHNVNISNIIGSGKDGRITKGDILEVISSEGSNKNTSSSIVDNPKVQESLIQKSIERVKMSKLRKTIARRLKDSQNTAAILSTFNEIDMTNVINLRKKYRDEFEKKHNVKLGFMSFFVKATVEALKDIPSINAEIDGDDIVYKNYYDIGVAVGTDQGLVVPVVRDSDKLTFAGVESTIADLGKKAREGKLSMSDLSGGTFTISNGGVYGSLLSTPIINPPQSGILGLHKTQERPVAIDGKIEIRQMMYIALSYDHRIIDGKEAVTFLVKVKEMIENPERLLLNI